MHAGARAGDAEVRGERRAGCGNYGKGLDFGDERKRGRGCRACLREEQPGAGSLGARRGGGFGRAERSRPGRKSDRDRSSAADGEISGKAWSEGASGIFLGRDGSESATTGRCDCGGDGNGSVVARESSSGGGYAAGIGAVVHCESRVMEGWGKERTNRKHDAATGRGDQGIQPGGADAERAARRSGRGPFGAARFEEPDDRAVERSGLGGNQYDRGGEDRAAIDSQTEVRARG